MRHALRQSDLRAAPRNGGLTPTARRRAFTLVEMLVAISIIVVLTTLSIGAFQFNASERTTASANIFKGAYERARAMAIRRGQPCGIRLVADPSDPRIVTSLQFIASQGYDEGTCRVEFVANSWTITKVNGTGTWANLLLRDLVGPGSRIEIPSRSGNWFTITADPVAEVVSVAGHFSDSSFDTTTGTWKPNQADPAEIADPTSFGSPAAIASLPLDFRLELRASPLPDDPVLLAPQTCIDLDGSGVERWRIREDADGDGALTIPPEVDVGINLTAANGQFDFAVAYDSIDILFGPDGQLTGDARSLGILHFRIAFISDVILAQTNGFRSKPLADTFTAPTYGRFLVPADPEKEHKAVSIFTNTGAILISEIDRAQDDSGPPFNSTPALNPFRFATQGRDTN